MVLVSPAATRAEGRYLLGSPTPVVSVKPMIAVARTPLLTAAITAAEKQALPSAASSCRSSEGPSAECSRSSAPARPPRSNRRPPGCDLVEDRRRASLWFANGVG